MTLLLLIAQVFVWWPQQRMVKSYSICFHRVYELSQLGYCIKWMQTIEGYRWTCCDVRQNLYMKCATSILINEFAGRSFFSFVTHSKQLLIYSFNCIILKANDIAPKNALKYSRKLLLLKCFSWVSIHYLNPEQKTISILSC